MGLNLKRLNSDAPADPILMYGRFLSILDTLELFTFACKSCHTKRINNPSGKIYPNCEKCRVRNLREGLPPLKHMFDHLGRPTPLHQQFTLDKVLRIIAKRFEQICVTYQDDDIMATTADLLSRFLEANGLSIWDAVEDTPPAVDAPVL